MDAISSMLSPHKDTIGTVTGYVTIGQMFSGSLICLDIYKQGSTKGVGAGPFIGGLVMSLLNLKFGFILRDDTMIKANFAGLALNLIYIMIFFNYTKEKTKTWMNLGLSVAMSGAILIYAEKEDPELVQNRFGLIITALMFTLISIPLFSLPTMIKKKTSEGIPGPIVASATLVTACWLTYGLAINNTFIVIQNMVAFSLCFIQFILFIKYPAKPDAKKKRSKKD